MIDKWFVTVLFAFSPSYQNMGIIAIPLAAQTDTTRDSSEGDLEENISLSLKGKFLVAMPKLLDLNFHKTVTCMTEFTSEGAMGIVINRVNSRLSGKDLFEELKIECVSDKASVRGRETVIYQPERRLTY